MDDGVVTPAKARPAHILFPLRDLARLTDGLRRSDSQRAAQELETPVDVRLHRGERPRIEIIRAAAAKLRLAVRAAENSKARPSLGAPVAQATAPLPINPVDLRRAQLDRAIAALKSAGIIVSVIDRTAALRRYWVTGTRDSQYAESVIAIAAARGLL